MEVNLEQNRYLQIKTNLATGKPKSIKWYLSEFIKVLL